MLASLHGTSTIRFESKDTTDTVARHSPAATSPIAAAVHRLSCAVRVREREASEPHGQCAQAHGRTRGAEARRPPVRLCAAAAAAAAAAACAQRARDPSALCSRDRSNSSHMLQHMANMYGVWGPTGAAHLDDGGLDEAIDEDAVDFEVAAPPAAPAASESRPREPLLPWGGVSPNANSRPAEATSGGDRGEGSRADVTRIDRSGDGSGIGCGDGGRNDGGGDRGEGGAVEMVVAARTARAAASTVEAGAVNAVASESMERRRQRGQQRWLWRRRGRRQQRWWRHRRRDPRR